MAPKTGTPPRGRGSRSATGHRAVPAAGHEYRKGALRALDRGDLRRIDVWVSVRDNAGNEAAGTPSRFTLTSVSSGGRRKRMREGKVRVRFGATAHDPRPPGVSDRAAAGRRPGRDHLRPARRRGAGGRGLGADQRVGRFGITVPKGTARLLIASPGAAGSLRTSAGCALRPASSSIRASRTRPRGRGHRPLRGSRARRGTGLIVVLQGREGGRWRTFADTRTGAGGRWSALYRFRGRPGPCAIRLRIRKQARPLRHAGAVAGGPGAGRLTA